LHVNFTKPSIMLIKIKMRVNTPDKEEKGSKCAGNETTQSNAINEKISHFELGTFSSLSTKSDKRELQLSPEIAPAKGLAMPAGKAHVTCFFPFQGLFL